MFKFIKNNFSGKSREQFYEKILSRTIKDTSASILVCGGGVTDFDVFSRLGFNNVVISNLDIRNSEGEFYPFKWKLENAEHLSYEDNSFDYVVIHAAIHHASSPHKVLTEMYRVCKRGFLAFESRDSFLMNIMEKLRLTETYETSAVFYNDCKYGGVNNSSIPNYVYRWTEREIEKTIQAYAPYYQHEYTYNYATAFPSLIGLKKNAILQSLFIYCFIPFYCLFKRILPRQQNLFSFFVSKGHRDSCFPWLMWDEEAAKFVFNKNWSKSIFINK